MKAFEKLDGFFSGFKLLKHRKGEVILRPGDTPQGVYLLHKGYVRLYSISENGEELTLIIFKPHDFFPIMWAINDAPNEQYLETITDVELYRAPKDAFLHFLTFNPDVFFELNRKMLERLGGILRRMEYLAFGNAYQKVASILLICAQRFGQKKDNGILIQVPLIHKDIGTLVGITRETASVEMKKLERKGIILYHGPNIVVSNINKLQEESLLFND